MKIQITGKGIELGESLRSYIEQEIISHVKKYFSSAIDAKIVIHKENHNFHVDITVHEGVKNGSFIKSSSFHANPYSAVIEAIIRLSGKLRRYKHKINDYTKPKKGIKVSQYMIEHNLDEKGLIAEQSENESNDSPLITEEKTIDVQVLSIAEAVMHMELTSVPALMFINKDNNLLNMIYEKRDGNIAWVEAPDALNKIS